MHQIANRPGSSLVPNNSGNTRAQVIVITAISLFALAGFLLGFTTGALNRPSHSTTPPQLQQNTKPIVNRQPSPTQTQTVQQKVRLGCPNVNWPWSDVPDLPADGTTSYTITAQAMDKSIDNTTACGKGKPVQQPGITCRLWLSKTTAIPDSIPGNIATLSQQTIPGEVQGGLAYDPTTQETQTCNANGQATWKFTISPSVDRGKYYIMVLTDWGGVYYNWTWYNVRVTKAG
jgi:hypothetical protein